MPSSQGKYKGRVHKLKPDQAEALRQDWKEGKYPSKMALGQAFGISQPSGISVFKSREITQLKLATIFSLAYENSWKR